MKRTYRPKRGLLYFLFGFPIFLISRIGVNELFGRDIELFMSAVWALVMALTFGILATFTRIFGK